MYLHVTTGVKPYQSGKGTTKQTNEILDNKPSTGFKKIDETWIPLIRGGSINKYVDLWNREYIKYGEWLAEPRKPEMFFNEKLFIRQTSDTLICTYDSTGKVGKNTIHCIYNKPELPETNLKYILGLINSKLLNWVFQHDNFHIVGKPLAKTKVIFVNRLPIIISQDTSPYIVFVEKLLTLNQFLYEKSKLFVNYIESSFKPKKVTENLYNVYNLDFSSFLDELKKQKVKLTETNKFELMPLFDNQKKELTLISKEILKMTTELDYFIYNLYELTDEEIAVVKGE